jgi:molybdopterin converting factor small subunit
MRIRVTVHGMLTVAVKDPDGRVEVTVPEGTNVQGVVEKLSERSPLLDPRACLAVMGGVKVPGDRALQDGDEVHLHLIVGGG